MGNRFMRIAKADEQDIETLKKYMASCEKRSGGKSRNFPNGWRRVIWSADLLLEKYSDPMVDHLADSPYYKEQHVAPEQ